MATRRSRSLVTSANRDSAAHLPLLALDRRASRSRLGASPRACLPRPRPLQLLLLLHPLVHRPPLLPPSRRLRPLHRGARTRGFRGGGGGLGVPLGGGAAFPLPGLGAGVGGGGHPPPRRQ